MVSDHDWVARKLAEIEEKRSILRSLEETLEKWEADVDWEQLPPGKQAALMALAGESVETLATLIGRLGEQISAGLNELAGATGEAGNND